MSTVKFVQLQFEELCVLLLLVKTLCLASARREKHNKAREFSEAFPSSSSASPCSWLCCCLLNVNMSQRMSPFTSGSELLRDFVLQLTEPHRFLRVLFKESSVFAVSCMFLCNFSDRRKFIRISLLKLFWIRSKWRNSVCNWIEMVYFKQEYMWSTINRGIHPYKDTSDTR